METKIKYRLSDAGKRASLKTGGDGKLQQTLICDLPTSILDLTEVVNVRPGGAWVEMDYDNSFDTPLTPETALAAIEAYNARTIASKAESIRQRQALDEKRETDRLQRISDLVAMIEDGTTVPLSVIRFDNEGRPTDAGITKPGFYNADWVSITDLALDSTILDTLATRKATAIAAAKEAERLEKLIATLPDNPKPLIPPTVQVDGSLRFVVPLGDHENDWAKLISSVDLSLSDGRAFQGDWLKCGQTAVMKLGDIVIAGTNKWSGSKRSGGYVKTRGTYVATQAGIVVIAGNSPNDAAILLNLEAGERQEKVLSYGISVCVEKITVLQPLATDPANGAIAEIIAARLAAWQARHAVLQSALIGTNETTTDFAAVKEAALAIIRVGYHRLWELYSTNRGGRLDALASINALASLNAGWDTLNKLLSLPTEKEKLSHFMVIVSNIGIVYDGDSLTQARNAFGKYVTDSTLPYGRGSGEQVTLLQDGEPISEYFPKTSEENDDND